ncbi:hypothetical protein TNCV_3856131 [Trichonephila clavipes]|nr:hypothetical protein TNCV_3856131 [Trichonephila clavipes]
MDAWKKFSIESCTEFISLFVKEQIKSILNARWVKIWTTSIECLLESPDSRIKGDIETHTKSKGGNGFMDIAIEDVEGLLAEDAALGRMSF